MTGTPWGAQPGGQHAPDRALLPQLPQRDPWLERAGQPRQVPDSLRRGDRPCTRSCFHCSSRASSSPRPSAGAEPRRTWATEGSVTLGRHRDRPRCGRLGASREYRDLARRRAVEHRPAGALPRGGSGSTSSARTSVATTCTSNVRGGHVRRLQVPAVHRLDAAALRVHRRAHAVHRGRQRRTCVRRSRGPIRRPGKRPTSATTARTSAATSSGSATRRGTSASTRNQVRERRHEDRRRVERDEPGQRLSSTSRFRSTTARRTPRSRPATTRPSISSPSATWLSQLRERHRDGDAGATRSGRTASTRPTSRRTTTTSASRSPERVRQLPWNSTLCGALRRGTSSRAARTSPRRRSTARVRAPSARRIRTFRYVQRRGRQHDVHARLVRCADEGGRRPRLLQLHEARQRFDATSSTRPVPGLACGTVDVGGVTAPGPCDNELYGYTRWDVGTDAYWRISPGNRFGGGSRVPRHPGRAPADYDEAETTKIFARVPQHDAARLHRPHQVHVHSTGIRISCCRTQAPTRTTCCTWSGSSVATTCSRSSAHEIKLVARLVADAARRRRLRGDLDGQRLQAQRAGDRVLGGLARSDRRLPRPHGRQALRDLRQRVVRRSATASARRCSATTRTSSTTRYHRNVDAGSCPTTSGGVTATNCFDPAHAAELDRLQLVRAQRGHELGGRRRRRLAGDGEPAGQGLVPVRKDRRLGRHRQRRTTSAIRCR